ncbi:hypothetical protein B0H19DRAFT_1069414 [Mycena capillaripes]|nr:hypothetical protein B0H19DRAFT_1069414 [Mycena capillaripes]
MSRPIRRSHHATLSAKPNTSLWYIVTQDPFLWHGSIRENFDVTNACSDSEIRETLKLIEMYEAVKLLKRSKTAPLSRQDLFKKEEKNRPRRVDFKSINGRRDKRLEHSNRRLVRTGVADVAVKLLNLVHFGGLRNEQPRSSGRLTFVRLCWSSYAAFSGGPVMNISFALALEKGHARGGYEVRCWGLLRSGVQASLDWPEKSTSIPSLDAKHQPRNQRKPTLQILQGII